MTIKIQQKLEDELKKMKTKLGLGGPFYVEWRPNQGPFGVHGEVRGNIILVYDEDEKEATKTCKHEFLEAVLNSEYLESKLFETKAHRRADRLIDVLVELL